MTPNPATDEPRSVDTVSTTDAHGVLYTHYIEPELRTKAIPRRVRLTDTKQVTRRWLWSLAVGSALLGVFLARSRANYYDTLATRGVVMQAEVIGIKDRTDSDGSNYQIYYAFNVGGYSASSSYNASESEFKAARLGDPVTVTYLPGSQGCIWQRGYVTHENAQEAALAWGTFGGFFAFAFAAFAWGFEQAWGREVSLLREGVAVHGVVQNGKATYDGDGGYCYSLTYSYWTGDGSHRNTISVMRDVYEAYTQGNPYLTVLYNAAKPEESRPYFQIEAACFEAPAIR